MSTARIFRAALEYVPPAPKARLYRAELSGTAIIIPDVPKVRLYRAELSGTAAVLVAPLTGQTVEPLSTVTLTAVLLSAGPADSWTWRRISGPSVGIEGTGATRTFVAPATMDGTEVVIGVTATKDGVTSNERTVTIAALPQLSWIWDGTAWQAAPISVLA